MLLSGNECGVPGWPAPPPGPEGAPELAASLASRGSLLVEPTLGGGPVPTLAGPPGVGVELELPFLGVFVIIVGAKGATTVPETTRKGF